MGWSSIGYALCRGRAGKSVNEQSKGYTRTRCQDLYADVPRTGHKSNMSIASSDEGFLKCRMYGHMFNTYIIFLIYIILLMVLLYVITLAPPLANVTLAMAVTPRLTAFSSKPHYSR